MLKICKITCRVRDGIKPPFFIGSKLRGSFGWALKATDGALFDAFFASQNAAHPYRFDFALGGERLDFSLYLFGDAVANAAIVCIALHKMLTQTGLDIGGQKMVFRDFALFLDGELVFESGGGRGANSNLHLRGEKSGTLNAAALAGEIGAVADLADLEREFAAQNSPRNLIVRLLTPLRLKKNNAFVRDANELDFNDILGSIFRRYYELLGGGRVKAPIFHGEIVRADARFVELVRSSSTQRTQMNLGGLLGELELFGVSAQTYALLRLAETIGVGKSCVFGLGKIAVFNVV